MSKRSSKAKTRQVTLGKKLMGGFLSIAFITLVVALLGLYGLRQVTNHISTAERTQKPSPIPMAGDFKDF